MEKNTISQNDIKHHRNDRKLFHPRFSLHRCTWIWESWLYDKGCSAIVKTTIVLAFHQWQRKLKVPVARISFLFLHWWESKYTLRYQRQKYYCLVTDSSVQFSSVQSLSHVRIFATPWIAACQSSLSITSSWSLHKPMSIELVMPSSHLILCHPLFLLPPILPSIRVFSNESTLCMSWPKGWSFSFNISPSNEHPGLISFRMDWLDLLAVQGTLKSLLQHHSSKASILRRSAFLDWFQILRLVKSCGSTAWL